MSLIKSWSYRSLALFGFLLISGDSSIMGLYGSCNIEFDALGSLRRLEAPAILRRSSSSIFISPEPSNLDNL